MRRGVKKSLIQYQLQEEAKKAAADKLKGIQKKAKADKIKKEENKG